MPDEEEHKWRRNNRRDLGRMGAAYSGAGHGRKRLADVGEDSSVAAVWVVNGRRRSGGGETR